jgi:serine phosphatase RsbU (regulator of sigma subunit)
MERDAGPLDALAQAAWLVSDLLGQAPVGAALFDRDLRCVRVNERLAAMTRHAPADLVGMRPEQILGGSSPHDCLRLARAALAGDVPEAIELSPETPEKRGTAPDLLLAWSPVRTERDEPVGALALLVEVSRRRRAEEASRRRERADRLRAEAFADLATVMAAAITIDEVAAAVANQAAAAAGAPFSNLALLDADGQRLHLHHHASLDAGVAQRWTEVSLTDPVPLVDAVRSGEPVLVRDPADNARRYPGLVADTRRAGLQATASIPLLARRQAPLGAIGFAWAEPQRFEPELQAVLRTIAELAAQAVERSRLHDQAQGARRRSSMLADATTAIGTPGSTRERLQRMCEVLVPRFADVAIAELPAERGARTADTIVRGDQARVSVPDGLVADDDLAARVTHRVTGVLAAGRVELVSDIPRRPGAGAALDTRARPLLDDLGVRSYLGVPLRAGAAVIGAVLLGQVDSGRRFDSDDAAFAADLGERAGLILDNVRLTDAEHEIAAELQQRLLPAALTAPPGIALAARYRAGHARLGVGGDWYEVVGRPDGRVVIAVGDVVGHGARAAAAMGQVRSALTAVASAADGPHDLLCRLDDFAGRTPDTRFSTVCVAFLEPDDGELRYACAGHPPPVLLRGDGSAELLEDGRSHPLALASSPGAIARSPSEGRALVPVGGRLVLYTDGLIERRGESLDVGLTQLLSTLRRHGDRPLEALCDALLGELYAGGEDDTALLCIERPAPDANPPRNPPRAAAPRPTRTPPHPQPPPAPPC